MTAEVRRLPLSTLLVGSCLAAAFAAQDAAPPTPRPDPGAPAVEVKEVVDALTLIVGSGSDEQRVRLHGVEPIRDRNSADRAVQLLDALLVGESVYLVRDRTDRGGGSETRAYVFRAPDGLFINLELVRQGLAPAATRGSHEHESLFRAYEARAKRAGKGMWAAKPSPAPRGATADAGKPRAEGASAGAGQDEGAPRGADSDTVYVTPKGTKYHRQGCVFLRDAGRAIPLSEARKSHEPCSRCNPPR